MQNGRLNKAADLRASLAEGLLGIDDAEVGVLLKIRHELLAVLVELLNLLGQDC